MPTRRTQRGGLLIDRRPDTASCGDCFDPLLPDLSSLVVGAASYGALPGRMRCGPYQQENPPNPPLQRGDLEKFFPVTQPRSGLYRLQRGGMPLRL